ncbi:MAG TPA: DegT/DnrJ/EryC1/StrS family aminotransferase [Conexivisphaerales archaeon]|nr:DegT/DnrJ/EryC1/StrS family aminotransferase [Conexivisphaerales archaeon]
MTLQDFEKRIADFFGTRYAIVTGSGRMALKIALQSLDVPEGEVVVPNLTCPIVPQTVISTGLTPLLVDVNRDLSLNQDILERRVNSSTKALLTSCLYGCPTDDMDSLVDISRDKDLWIIEDAAQAFGARIMGKYTGSSGDIGVLSFAKVFFPLYRGGALITSNEELANRAYIIRRDTQTESDTLNTLRYFFKRLRGSIPKDLKKRRLRSLNADELEQGSSGLYEAYEPSSPYHFQGLTDVEVTVGIRTLDNLEHLIAKRREITKSIYSAISSRDDLHLQPLHPYRDEYVYSRIPVLVESSSLHEWMVSFLEQGEFIGMAYPPLSNNELIRHKCTLLDDYSVSEDLSSILLPLPVNRNVVEILKRKARV